MEQTMNTSRQVELSDEEIKIIIAILRFSKDACPIESLPENIDDDYVESLINVRKNTCLVTLYVVYNTPTYNRYKSTQSYL